MWFKMDRIIFFYLHINKTMNSESDTLAILGRLTQLQRENSELRNEIKRKNELLDKGSTKMNDVTSTLSRYLSAGKTSSTQKSSSGRKYTCKKRVCSGRTKSGDKCHTCVTGNSKFCSRHKGQRASSPHKKSGQCTRRSSSKKCKTGRVCGAKTGFDCPCQQCAVGNYKRCYQHRGMGDMKYDWNDMKKLPPMPALESPSDDLNNIWSESPKSVSSEAEFKLGSPFKCPVRSLKRSPCKKTCSARTYGGQCDCLNCVSGLSRKYCYRHRK